MLNQDTHSPKATSARKRLLKKSPLSIQLNSEQIRRYNSDHAPSTKVEDSSSPFFFTRNDRSPRKSFLKLAHQISDVFSSKQLKNAIDSTKSVHDRLKMLDYVLMQRKQKKDQEDQERLERAAPVIKHFHQNIKMKINVSQQGSPVSRFRSLCQDLKTEGNLTHSKSEIPSLAGAGSITALLSTARLETTQETERAKRRNSIDIKGPISYVAKEHRRRSHQPLLGIPLKTDMHTEPAPSIALLEPPHAHFGSESNLPVTPRRNSFQPVYSRNQILDKFTSFLNKKTKNEINLDDKKINSGWKAPVLHYVKKGFQDQAKRTLEEDLCRYLITHGQEDEGVKCTFSMGKRSQIKQIEKNAISRFESFANNKKGSEVETGKKLKPVAPSPRHAPTSPRSYKGSIGISRQTSNK